MAKIQGVQIQDYFLGKNLFQLTPKFQQIRYLKIGQTLSRNGQKQENVKGLYISFGHFHSKTVWLLLRNIYHSQCTFKLQKFSVTQILCEINFENS